MRVLLTGGGTAGHINPALFIAQYIKKQKPNTEFLYVGNKNKMESKLVPKAGIDFVGLETSGISRSISFSGIKHNIKAVIQQIEAGNKAKKIIKDFNPDIVIGTGGYVCVPIMRQAAKLKYKTIIHESNSFVGIATKMVAKRMDAVLVVNEDAKNRLPKTANVEVTGNPISEDFIFYGREKARKELGIKENEFCILSFGGSLGAELINKRMASVMAFTKDYPNIKHIHATGAFYKDEFPQMLKQNGVNAVQYNDRFYIREYIDDMARCFNAADLIISRAGASTINEISCSSKASILIPSPNVTENHQYHNAMYLGSRDGAIVIEEKDLSDERIVSEIKNLIENPNKIKKIQQNAGKFAIVDSNQRIYNKVKEILSFR